MIETCAQVGQNSTAQPPRRGWAIFVLAGTLLGACATPAMVRRKQYFSYADALVAAEKALGKAMPAKTDQEYEARASVFGKLRIDALDRYVNRRWEED